MEAVGTARLTDRIPAERAVAASIPRREIRDVLAEADATPELTLDVVAGDGSREHGTISITWSRDELERLLAGASGDEVVLTFDQNELRAALDDVEAHGLRTRAAVFAVAAVGALGTSAAIANASEVADTGGPVAASTAPAFTDASSGGGYATPSQGDAAALAALQARSEGMNVQAAVSDSGSTGIVTDASTSGPATTPSQGDAAALAALQARSEGMNVQAAVGDSGSTGIVTDASTSGPATTAPTGAAAAAQALAARSAAMNQEYATTDAGSTGIVTDASTGGYATPPTSDSGGSFQIQAPSTDDALIAGAALLAIAGAAFAARRGTLHLPH